MSHSFWNIDWAPTPEEWTALWAFLALIVTIIAVVMALLQLRAYFDERFDRARLYVLVDYHFKAGFVLQVEVSNASQTPASNVRLSVEPPFRSTNPGQAEILSRISAGNLVITVMSRWVV